MPLSVGEFAEKTCAQVCNNYGPGDDLRDADERVEGVKDVVMYNANYNRNLNIVDSIFEYTTGEPYDGFDFMNPASAKLYSCTLANWVRPDVEFSIEGHAYDYVPFVTNYVGATRRP